MFMVSNAVAMTVLLLLCLMYVGGLKKFPLASVVWLIACCCLFPAKIVSHEAPLHVGISSPVFEIRTFHIAILLCAIIAFFTKFFFALRATAVGMIMWLAAGAYWWWERSSEVASGVWHLTFSMLALSAALLVAQGDTGENLRVVFRVCAGIIFIQCAVALLQFGGVPINSLESHDASILGNRVNGVSNHPNNLGKILFVLVGLMLPFTKSVNLSDRRVAQFALAAAFIPLILAQGRANMISALIMCFLWVIFQPRTSPVPGGEFAFAGSIVASLGASYFIISRFQEDPNGGVRHTLNDIAMERLPDFWLFGCGPNSYVTAVSSVQGSFIPVHNSFLLAIIEFGVVGAAMIAGPFLVNASRALMSVWEDSAVGDWSRSILYQLPGVVLIGATGWGLLGTSILPLWLLFSGIFWAGRQHHATRRAEPTRGTRTLASSAV